MKMKDLIVVEGAYEDGINDGKRGHRNPRASSIYGPSSDHYEKGYQHGITLGKKEGEANIRKYHEWLKPFLHLSNEELHDLAEKFRSSPDDRMANGQPYPYNSKFQAIHQVLGHRKRDPNYGLDAKHGVAEGEIERQHGDLKPWAYWNSPERVAKKLYQIHKGEPVGKAEVVHLWKTDGPDRMTKFMLKPDLAAILSAYEQMSNHGSLFKETATAGATSSASIASVPNPDYANNANKKPVKSVSALDQNQVSLFGGPMENMKNTSGKKAAIIKRR